MKKNYRVENYDGFVIGEYETIDEAVEAAKTEWEAQHEACTNDDDLDPNDADEEWIFINKIDSEVGGGYVTRGGKVKLY